jgi:hypothetical protein
LLSDVTRTFRENGLLVAQAEVSTKGDMATSVFYVTGTTASQPVHQSAMDAVRERVGIDCLVVEEHRPQLYEDDHNGVGIGLLYGLGNLVKMKFYNLGLIWMSPFRNKSGNLFRFTIIYTLKHVDA